MNERLGLWARRLVLGLYAVDAAGVLLMIAPLIVGPLKSPSTVNLFHLSMTASAFALAALLFVPRREFLNRVGVVVVLSLLLFMGFMGLDMVLADRYENLWRAEMTIHIVLGIGVAAPFVLVFVASHAWRQRKLQWSRQGWVGHLSWIPFRVALWCGVFAGFAVGPAWFFQVHRWGMGIALLGVAVHLAHIWRDMTGASKAAVGILVAGGLVPFAALRVWLWMDPSPRLLAQNDFIARAGRELASSPPPVRSGDDERHRDGVVASPTATSRTPRALLENSRASCGEFGCHEPLLKQWESSPHRHSANAFYRKAAAEVVRARGVQEVRLCARCHDPVAVLSSELDDPNLGYPPSTAGGEGIPCLVCHSLKPHQEDVGNGSYDFVFPTRFFTRIQNIYTAHDLKQEHSAEFKSDAMRSPEACGACHRVVFPASLTGSHEIVEQDPYFSWKEGPYHGRDHPRFVRESDCRECHMVKDTRERPGRIEANHRFAVSNSTQPFLTGDPEQARAVEEFLKGEIVTLTLRPLEQPGRFEIGVANDRVGHVFPAGPLELNDVWLEVRAEDERGHEVLPQAILGQGGGVRSSGVIRNDGRFSFGSFLEGRRLLQFSDLLGVEAAPTKVSIPPRETLVVPARVEIERGDPTKLTVEARLLYRKFNPEFSKWVLGYDADLPVIEIAKVSRVLEWPE